MACQSKIAYPIVHSTTSKPHQACSDHCNAVVGMRDCCCLVWLLRLPWRICKLSHLRGSRHKPGWPPRRGGAVAALLLPKGLKRSMPFDSPSKLDRLLLLFLQPQW